MNKAGFWTATWVAIVCVAGGSRLMRNSHGAAGVGSDVDEIAQARRLGVPIDPLSDQSASVPPAQNSAELYRQMEPILEANKKLLSDLQLAGLNMPGNPTPQTDPKNERKMRAAADAALPTLEPIFVLAQQLDTHPKCQFAHEVDASGNPQFSVLNAARSVAKDLCLKADYEDRQGRWPDAMKDLRLANRASVDVGSGPGIMGLFQSIWAHGITLSEYEVLIQRHSHDADFLKAAAAQIAEESSRPDLHRFITTAMVDLRSEIQDIQSFKELRDAFGTGSSVDDVLTTNFLTGKRLQSELDARLMAVWISLYPKLPKDPYDWQAYLHVVKQANDQAQADGSALSSLNQSTLSQMVSSVEREGQMVVADQILLDSVKLLQIRAVTGKLPEILPASFGAARIDPFGGNPLRYRLQDNGFILYSVDKDGVDNGGRKRGPNDMGDTGWDLVESFN